MRLDRALSSPTIIFTPVKTRNAPKSQTTHSNCRSAAPRAMKIAAEDEGAEDAEEEHPVLVGRRHPEVAEHHDEHEDVVDRERVLDDVAGEELERGLAGGERRVEARASAMSRASSGKCHRM